MAKYLVSIGSRRVMLQSKYLSESSIHPSCQRGSQEIVHPCVYGIVGFNGHLLLLTVSMELRLRCTFFMELASTWACLAGKYRLYWYLYVTLQEDLHHRVGFAFPSSPNIPFHTLSPTVHALLGRIFPRLGGGSGLGDGWTSPGSGGYGVYGVERAWSFRLSVP